jgi:hypothetical protein
MSIIIIIFTLVITMMITIIITTNIEIMEMHSLIFPLVVLKLSYYISPYRLLSRTYVRC